MDLSAKKIGFLILVVVVMASCGNTELNRTVDSDVLDLPATLRNEKIEKMPEITFEKYEYDTGLISQGEILNYTYKFKNTGNAPLVLSSVSASCGCTVTKNYSKGKIYPGETGEIDVEFDSDNKWGELDVVINVSSNAIPAITQLFIKTHIVVPDNLKTEENKIFN